MPIFPLPPLLLLPAAAVEKQKQRRFLCLRTPQPPFGPNAPNQAHRRRQLVVLPLLWWHLRVLSPFQAQAQARPLARDHRRCRQG